MPFQRNYTQLDGVKVELTGPRAGLLPHSLITGLRHVEQNVFDLQSSTSSSAISVTQDSHAQRLLRPAAGVAVGSLYLETDRDVLYLSRLVSGVPQWVYSTGVMTGAFSARPTDLTLNDFGFLFFSTGAQEYQLYQWTGNVWIEITPANDVQIAYANANLSLAVAQADVSGATITLNRAGRYLILATFYFVSSGVGDNGSRLDGFLSANGVVLTPQAVFLAITAGEVATCSQQWTHIAGSVGQVVKLRGAKSGGTGSSVIGTDHTSISATWIGP